MNPESPAVWDAEMRAIAVQNASLEFRDRAAGKNQGLGFFIFAAAQAVIVLAFFPW